MKILVSGCIILITFVLIVLVSSIGHAGQVTMSLKAPTLNADGTALTDLAGYKIYYGTVTGKYTNSVDVGNVTHFAFVLPDGTYYFVATAYNTAKIESKYSNELSKIVKTPVAPGIN